MSLNQNGVRTPAPDVGRFGNPYFRWTIFYGGIIITLTLSPLFTPFLLGASTAYYVNAIFVMWFSLMWLAIAFNAGMNFWRVSIGPAIPSIAALATSRVRKFTHAVIVPCYIDPVDVLFDCIGSLLLQKDPKSIIVVVTFEAKTPELQRKKRAVEKAFTGRFKELLIVIHTVLPATEIPGGCSNKNFALREMNNYLNLHKDEGEYAEQGHSVTVTTCDTDSLFNPNYFQALENAYNEKNPDLHMKDTQPHMCIWQSPLFYNWDLDQRPFFNRVTGIMRSMMMLGGLISFNLNPMSIFSYPLELGLQAGFINPRYSVDDIIFKVRLMCEMNIAVPVILLPVASISGPTIGTTWWEEVVEWARQIRRWIVGSSESFHYFVIHWKGKPLWGGLAWFFCFFNYYAVLLCSSGIFTLLAGLPFPWLEDSPVMIISGHCIQISSIPLYSIAIQYLVFAVGFTIDRLAIQNMTVQEDISIFRNVLHWLLALPTLLVYSFIAFYGIALFILKGKRFAGHDMAAKDGFVAKTLANGNALNAPLIKYEVGDGDGDGDGDDQETQDQKIEYTTKRIRSTSMSREAALRIDNRDCDPLVSQLQLDYAKISASASASASALESSEGGEDDLLCSLPANFYFGEYNQSVL
jgi:cellulose synthase/poly-beta-1,6-N-acetylglucosamine synthase-like glycosyltransferase